MLSNSIGVKQGSGVKRRAGEQIVRQIYLGGRMDLLGIFEGLDITKIDDFITRNQEENLHLDFKLINSPGLNREDRRSLQNVFQVLQILKGG